MAIRINGRIYKNWDKLRIETLAHADTKQATYDEKNELRQYMAFRGQMESLKKNGLLK